MLASTLNQPQMASSPMEIKIWTSFLLAICCFSGAHGAGFTLRNNCPYTISPTSITGSGSRVPSIPSLQPKGSTGLTIPPPWSGRIYARFSGDGGYPPATLAEFTLGGGGGNDYYDVSLVDGFNLPMRISPSGGCRSVSCPVDINNRGCPNELAIRGGGGGVVGCRSACLAFGRAEDCCTGAFAGSACRPTGYSQRFKNQCPEAYTYAKDDGATAGCRTGNSYTITFCP